MRPRGRHAISAAGSRGQAQGPKFLLDQAAQPLKARVFVVPSVPCLVDRELDVHRRQRKHGKRSRGGVQLDPRLRQDRAKVGMPDDRNDRGQAGQGDIRHCLSLKSGTALHLREAGAC
jgi:hypothetical protein